MSRWDYLQSKNAAATFGFYTLVMGAMREADTRNAQRLAEAFPETWAELRDRYNAPNGYLAGES